MTMRIVSTSPSPYDIKVYVDDVEVTGEMLPSVILLEGRAPNTAWFKVEGVELDLEVEEGDVRPFNEMLVRELKDMADELLGRQLDLEEEVRRLRDALGESLSKTEER